MDALLDYYIFFGICALTFCYRLPSLYWLLIFAPVVFIWFIGHLSSRIKQILVIQKVKRIFLQILVFFLGFSWALIYTHIITFWRLPEELEGKKILITGYVATPPHNKLYGVNFEFKTKTIAGEKTSTKLKLGWYSNYQKKDSLNHPPLKVGDKWQLLVRLKRPHGVLNPGGNDSEKHLLIHGIRATGYVVNSEFNKILTSKLYHYPLARLRQFLINKIEQVLISEDLAPIIIALVTGAEDKITKPQWQIMRDTGTSYLVAIAGLHIGLVASIAFVFVQFLWRLSGFLPLLMPAKEVGIIVGLIMGFIYGAVSGFSIPTQRSLVMLFMFSISVLFRRHSLLWNAWLWSLFLVLLINPLAVLTIGFWLSFTAIGAIIYATSGRISKQKMSHFGKLWRMQLIVTLALLPCTLLFFQQFSFITLLANLLAMPLVCLVVVPMSLLGALCLLIGGNLGSWILFVSAKFLHLAWWWLTFLSTYLNYSWYQPIYNVWILIAAVIGVLILLAPPKFPTKTIGWLWLLPIFFYTPKGPDTNNQVWFTLLDVGQGWRQ